MEEHINPHPKTEEGETHATEEKGYICSKQCATCQCQTKNSIS